MKIYLLCLSLCVVSFLQAQKTDKQLQEKVEAIIKGFRGEVGVFIKNLNNDKIVSINADTVFPTASMIKIPILVGIMSKIEKGELTYHQELQYKDSLLYEGVDILGSFKNNEKIELSKVLMLMLSTSDNTASLWLQSLAGTGEQINFIMDSLGFKNTRVNSRTPGREGARSLYGWGQTSPREMATLLEAIYKGTVASKGATDRMLRLLNRNYWDAEAVSQIPPYATTFSKNGAVDQSRSEVVLVRGIKSHYVFCVTTKNNVDTTWTESNEAWTMIKKISALLWNYFEPKDKWKLAEEAAKYN